jgi:hypothetical protein
METDNGQTRLEGKCTTLASGRRRTRLLPSIWSRATISKLASQHLARSITLSSLFPCARRLPCRRLSDIPVARCQRFLEKVWKWITKDGNVCTDFCIDCCNWNSVGFKVASRSSRRRCAFEQKGTGCTGIAICRIGWTMMRLCY